MEKVKSKNLKSFCGMIRKIGCRRSNSKELTSRVTSKRKAKNRTIEYKENRKSGHPTERKKTKAKVLQDNFMSLESNKKVQNPRHLSFLNMRNMPSQRFEIDDSFNVDSKHCLELFSLYDRNCRSAIKNSKRKNIKKNESQIIKLKSENSSKNTKISILHQKIDSLTSQVDCLNEEVSKLKIKLSSSEMTAKHLENKYLKSKSEIDSLNSCLKKIYSEYTFLAQEKDKSTLQWELSESNYQTKIRLLEEVLTKKNKEWKESEQNNKELVEFIEEINQKISKMEEDYQLEKIKCEKYEVKLGLVQDDFEKIDVDTLDGRINFLVGLLEQYRKMLEEEETEESCDEKGKVALTPKKKKSIYDQHGNVIDIAEEDRIAIKTQKYYFLNSRPSGKCYILRDGMGK
ncbi:unnamed protein product [Moneuplotes crassus]|uniref:Uncharacterized protein n=1 Tax=Euplotes crassus TaxID=5936 RepID=A0AAD1UBD8_EUPCR|nr:unnamed protein product [Moneuplotes crassus]